MIVVVDNLGPVHHAEIDLNKRLIVFAGPNHTGKTHIAWMLYGLMKQRPFVRKSWFTASPEPLEPAKQLVEKIVHMGDAGVPGEELGDCIRKCFQIQADTFSAGLPSYFVTERELFAKTTIQLQFDKNEYVQTNEGVVFHIRLHKSGMISTNKTTTNKSNRAILFITNENNIIFSDLSPSTQNSIKKNLAHAIMSHVASHADKAQYVIFPAERTAVSLFAHELASSRVDLVDQILEDPENATIIANRTARRYPGPIMDCVRTANNLVVLGRDVSSFVSLAAELEMILGGKVDVSPEGEIGFTLEGGRPRVPFHISASVVKSLASLVFYFRHQANKNDTIVIDEPELNLHPDLQRKVARFLAKAVRQGFRVMMSTHSDYILREISNLVRLGEAGDRGKELAAELGFDQESLVSALDVGVWYFHDGKAEALEINGSGFNLPTIENVIIQQNLETQQIEFGIDE